MDTTIILGVLGLERAQASRDLRSLGFASAAVELEEFSSIDYVRGLVEGNADATHLLSILEQAEIAARLTSDLGRVTQIEGPVDFCLTLTQN